MDRKDEEVELEDAPKGMFPEDDEDIYEIDVEEDLDVWNRGSGYTWGVGEATSSWWSTGGSLSGGFSSMWSTASSFSTDGATRMLKHKKHIDSLCKVVDPTVKHTLEFATEDGQNYTDMTRGHIVVDGNLIRYDDEKLDILSGLAIHEKLHVIHSVPLHKWQKDYIYDGSDSPMSSAQRRLFASIANIVEDEYIERQLQKTCSGYVHYLTKCKEHFFDKSDIEDETDVNNFGEIINTFLLLVRYPSRLGIDRRKAHAFHIRAFMAELKKGIDNRENTYRCIENVYKYMLKVAEDMSDGEVTDEDMDRIDKDASSYADETMDEWMSDLSDEAISEMESEGKIEAMKEDVRTRRAERLLRELETRLSDPVEELFLDAHHEKIMKAVKYDSDTIDKKLALDIKDLEQSDYYEEKLDKNLAISSKQRDITWKRAIPESYDVDKYKAGVRAMKPEISKLKKKIELYGNTQKLSIYNQKRGILDKRKLHKIPMGMNDIFKAVIVNEDKPIDICILVDESGSMGYRYMDDARNSAIAIKEALGGNEKVNLWVYGHSADEYKNGQTEMIEYWSPTMKDRPMAIGAMRARYENRDGNAIISSALRVKGESDNNSKKLMIVLSDGAPSADAYRGSTALSHTKRAVKYVEGQGWNIIQVGFGGASRFSMEKMFTNWIRVKDSSELGSKLSKVIRKVIQI